MSFADVEIACNLLANGDQLMGKVFKAVQRLSQQKGITVADNYRIGKSREEYARMAAAQIYGEDLQ